MKNLSQRINSLIEKANRNMQFSVAVNLSDGDFVRSILEKHTNDEELIYQTMTFLFRG